MAIFYMDPIGGNDANDGTTFANRRKTTLPTVAAGDTVRYMKSSAPVSLGNVTWTNDSTLELASARTLDLYKGGDGAWTAAANVTASLNNNRKVGGSQTASISIAAGFTTGRVAHFATGTKDCSSYEKLHIWIRSSALADASILQVVLCSDTGGTTAVNTLTLPAINLFANTYTSFTLDNGAALGSAIESVAIYATSDPGVITLQIDNIFVTNDISCNSLISKDDVEAPDIANGDAPWFPIRSIVGTTITLEYGGQAASNATASPGYFGTTETVTSYMLQPTTWPVSAAVATTSINIVPTSGSVGSPITFSGGWNTTDMSTQTGASWYSLTNGGGYFWAGNNRTYINLERMGLRGGYQFYGSSASAANFNVSRCGAAATTNMGFQINSTVVDGQINSESLAAIGCALGFEYLANNSSLESIVSVLNSGRAFQINSNGRNLRFQDCVFVDGVTNAVFVIGSANITAKNLTIARGVRGIYMDTSADARFDNVTITGSSTCAVQLLGATAKFFDLTTSGNNNVGFDFNTRNSRVECYNWTYDESSPFSSASTTFADSRLISTYDDGVADACVIYSDGSIIDAQTATRHTASGIGWRMRPTSENRAATYPVWQRIATVFCEAGVAKTVSVWVQRDDTNITGRLLLKANDIVGVTTDQAASITAAINTWEQISITFTPTTSQFVDVYMECWGGTTHSFYWDDFAASPTSSLDTSAGDYLKSTCGAAAAVTGGGSGSSVTTAYAFIS